MKFITLILLALSLQGCAYQSVNETELSLANQFCESKGSKVVKLNSLWIGKVIAVCRNQERGTISL